MVFSGSEECEEVKILTSNISCGSRGVFWRDGDDGDFGVAVFFEVVMARKLVEGFAAQA